MSFPFLLRPAALVVAMALGAAALAPVQAQCLLCAGSSTGSGTGTTGDGAATELDAHYPLRISVTADLDFSRMVAGNAGGSMVIDARSGRSSAAGAVASLGGMGFSGQVRVEGAPGRSIMISLPTQIELVSTTGGRAMVRDITATVPSLARLGADGRLDFAFGGRLDVAGGADGDYRGRIPITVTYE
ncbi:MAG: DUF4402 domain-containing protein [Sphingopyxis sp.]